MRRHVRGEPFAVTDADGRFQVRVAEGTSLSLRVGSQSQDYEVGRTDSSGRFEVFTRGKHRIGARRVGHAPSLQRLVEVAPGSTAEVELRLRGPGGAIRGKLVDHAGKPVAGAHVLVGTLDAGGNRATAERWGEQRGWDLVTDTEGGFLAESVAPGMVDVQAWGIGFGPAAQKCEVEGGGRPRSS